jgi:hypothetical protein
MKPGSLEKMPVLALVERFKALCLAQYEAELRSEGSKENGLIKEMWAVSDELKRRSGDQRSQLISLYTHSNARVRLMAAKQTLAVAPAAARQLLEAIQAAKSQPEALDAGMCLWALDDGSFKPT